MRKIKLNKFYSKHRNVPSSSISGIIYMLVNAYEFLVVLYGGPFNKVAVYKIISNYTGYLADFYNESYYNISFKIILFLYCFLLFILPETPYEFKKFTTLHLLNLKQQKQLKKYSEYSK